MRWLLLSLFYCPLCLIYSLVHDLGTICTLPCGPSCILPYLQPLSLLLLISLLITALLLLLLLPLLALESSKNHTYIEPAFLWFIHNQVIIWYSRLLFKVIRKAITRFHFIASQRLKSSTMFIYVFFE